MVGAETLAKTVGGLLSQGIPPKEMTPVSLPLQTNGPPLSPLHKSPSVPCLVQMFLKVKQ